METSVIIVHNNTNIISTTEYDKYFDKTYLAKSKEELFELFKQINSDYVVVILENAYYAEDMYALYFYTYSHNLDFTVSNRIYTHQYNNTNKIYKILNKHISSIISKQLNCHIPDLFSSGFILSKNLYKCLENNQNFQLECIKKSKKFAYIDIRYITQTYSVLNSIRQYIYMILHRKDI